MYRAYENPRTLEDMLHDARDRYEALRWEKDADPEEMYRVHEEIEDLKERINHAWQDDEFQPKLLRESARDDLLVLMMAGRRNCLHKKVERREKWQRLKLI